MSSAARLVLCGLVVCWSVHPAWLQVAGGESLLRWGSLAALLSVAALPGRSHAEPALPVLHLFFVAALLVSLLANPASTTQLADVLRTLLLVLVLRVVARQRWAERTDAMLRMLAGTLAMIVVVSLGSMPLNPLAWDNGRLFGMTYHPNILALCAAALLLLPQGLLPGGAVFQLIVRAAALAALLLSGSLLRRRLVAPLVRGRALRPASPPEQQCCSAPPLCCSFCHSFSRPLIKRHSAPY